MFLVPALTALLGVSSSAYAAGPTTLPFTEEFGTGYKTIGCANQWVGECERHWTSYGDASSLQLKENGAEVAVMIVPASGTVNSNGLKRRFSVTAGKELSVSVETIATYPNNGKAEVGLQFKFRNGAGVVVGTKLKTFTLAGERTIAMNEIVPAGAVTVDVAIGVNNPTNSYIRMNFPIIILIIGDAPPPAEECSVPQTCNESCNETCAPGEILIDECVEMGPPACTAFRECYCADQADGESPAQQGANWTDF